MNNLEDGIPPWYTVKRLPPCEPAPSSDAIAALLDKNRELQDQVSKQSKRIKKLEEERLKAGADYTALKEEAIAWYMRAKEWERQLNIRREDRPKEICPRS